MKKFPNTLHVVREGDPGEEYLAVYENGIEDIDKAETKVAVYKLVSEGTVDIQRVYRETKGHS